MTKKEKERLCFLISKAIEEEEIFLFDHVSHICFNNLNYASMNGDSVQIGCHIEDWEEWCAT